METIIITGASSGLGREYAKAAARRFPEAELWLVARGREGLEKTASLLGSVKTKILTADLATEAGLDGFNAELEREQPSVRLLVNNAGFGKLGDVKRLSYAVQRRMVELNCGATTAVSAMTIPYMRRGSCIIQVASIASFAPTPSMTVYSATKAYVFAFARGLRAELRSDGINVLAVCPGPMDTNFLDVANITGNSRMFAILPYCDPQAVARRSLGRALAGAGVYTDRMIYKCYRLLAKVLPHSLVVRCSGC